MKNEEKSELKLISVAINSNLQIGKCYRVDNITEHEIQFREVDSQFAIKNPEGIVNFGAFSIDFDKKKVLNAKGTWKDPTKTEWKLLELLASRPDFTFDSQVLLVNAWGPDYINDIQYLRVWISRVRDLITGDLPGSRPQFVKIAGELTPIVNVQGIGYRLNTDWRPSS